jgi:hypothetical protein
MFVCAADKSTSQEIGVIVKKKRNDHDGDFEGAVQAFVWLVSIWSHTNSRIRGLGEHRAVLHFHNDCGPQERQDS